MDLGYNTIYRINEEELQELGSPKDVDQPIPTFTPCFSPQLWDIEYVPGEGLWYSLEGEINPTGLVEGNRITALVRVTATAGNQTLASTVMNQSQVRKAVQGPIRKPPDAEENGILLPVQEQSDRITATDLICGKSDRVSLSG